MPPSPCSICRPISPRQPRVRPATPATRCSPAWGKPPQGPSALTSRRGRTPLPRRCERLAQLQKCRSFRTAEQPLIVSGDLCTAEGSLENLQEERAAVPHLHLLSSLSRRVDKAPALRDW